MCFQSETSVFKFIGRSVEFPLKCLSSTRCKVTTVANPMCLVETAILPSKTAESSQHSKNSQHSSAS